ncbi:MAG: penicillin-binding protein 2 [Micrococcaceae bacterium]|nr:penicillin-binding protein 2 [Micrococcaceae bacterium]MDN5878623.1 penicillin-binding protein 2 [Micrococcaceae bacterium]MDN5886107.1 penicillin-binding protein 2 [Micrococcaceae bacterium]MDN6168872.1 penicillin-binding protein 2 [Micrococcaceae bacterium]
MNTAIRHVWIAIVCLFVLIFGALSYIQFFAVKDLNANPLNTRQLYKNFDLARGALLVDGTPIAESVASDDQFDYQRVYHDPKLYAHLTGFYSLTYGANHLEGVMNDELNGQSDSQFYNRMVNLLTGQSTEGASVELTIDPALQKTAYNLIPDGQQGTIIVSEPKTGKILAMVSKPSYDTNLLAVHSGKIASKNMADILETNGLSPNINPAINNLISPGSTFKILDLVAGLESGKYDLDSVYDNPTSITLPGTSTKVNNFDQGICANQNRAKLEFIVAQSCNTPFVAMSEAVGQDALRDVTERFGFGQQLEIPQRVTPSQFPSDLTPDQLGLSSIGQFDVKTTPLQMNMVAMGIANDGVIMKPNLIKRVTAPDLSVLEEPKPEEFSTATTKKVANQVTELMRGPLKGGTAYTADIPGLDIAAKTGTAQLGDGTKRVNSWITGFAPADDPEVAVTIVIEKTDYETGHNLTSPNLKKMLEAVFNK